MSWGTLANIAAKGTEVGGQQRPPGRERGARSLNLFMGEFRDGAVGPLSYKLDDRSTTNTIFPEKSMKVMGSVENNIVHLCNGIYIHWKIFNITTPMYVRIKILFPVFYDELLMNL